MTKKFPTTILITWHIRAKPDMWARMPWLQIHRSEKGIRCRATITLKYEIIKK